MDLVFGDTAAHEEKARLFQIAELEGRGSSDGDDVEKIGRAMEVELK